MRLTRLVIDHPRAAMALVALALVAVACSGQRARREDNARTEREVEFSPAEVRIGDMLTVRGRGWTSAKVTIYLIPESEARALRALEEARRSGDLLVLGRAEVLHGELLSTVRVPEALKSENGRRTMSVVPGRYSVGVEEPGTLVTSGYVFVRQ